MQPPLEDDVLAETVEVYLAHRRQRSKAAAKLGIAQSTLGHRLKIASERGLFMRQPPAMPGFVVAGRTTREGPDGRTTTTIVEKPERRQAGNLPAGLRLKGVSRLVAGDTEVLRWEKAGEEAPDLEALVRAMREALADVPRAGIIAPPESADDDLLTVYVLPDLHLGLLSYAPETGERYDLKSAAALVQREVGALVGMTPPSAHAVVLVLGDMFHSNDQTNTTPTSNHQLDVDSRWEHVYRVGTRTLVALAHAVAHKHRSAELAIIPGNHDQDAARTLRVALDLHFEGHDRIMVYARPSEHWYRRFGKVLIGAHHGHRMKPDRMAMMLATDKPEDWGLSKHRHFFFGHVHHEVAKEVGPVRVESFQSPAAKDAYAAASGYRSGRSLTAVTFHAERGERYRHRVNIEPVP